MLSIILQALLTPLEWTITVVVLGWAVLTGKTLQRLNDIETKKIPELEKEMQQLQSDITSINKSANEVTGSLIQIMDKLNYMQHGMDKDAEADKEYKTEMRENLKEVFNRFNTQEENIRKFYAANPTIKQAERKYP